MFVFVDLIISARDRRRNSESPPDHHHHDFDLEQVSKAHPTHPHNENGSSDFSDSATEYSQSTGRTGTPSPTPEEAEFLASEGGLTWEKITNPKFWLQKGVLSTPFIVFYYTQKGL